MWHQNSSGTERTLLLIGKWMGKAAREQARMVGIDAATSIGRSDESRRIDPVRAEMLNAYRNTMKVGGMGCGALSTALSGVRRVDQGPVDTYLPRVLALPEGGSSP
jgi:hypothetical protein